MSTEEFASRCEVEPILIVYYDYVNTILFGTSSLGLTSFIYIFIHSYLKSKLKTIKLLFYSGTTFFIMIFIALLSYSFWSINRCHNWRISTIFHLIATQLYILQTMMLAAILFYRLYKVFKTTKFALNILTIRLFSTCYIIASLIGIGAGITYSTHRTIGRFIGSIAGIFGIIIIGYIFILYVYKLFLVYKSEKDEDLINVITKTSLLAFISIFNTFLVFTIIPLISVINSVHFSFIWNVLVVMDLYTNFFCIYLQYKYFNPYYLKICGVCDRKCVALWSKCIATNPNLQNEILPSRDSRQNDGDTVTPTNQEMIATEIVTSDS